MVCRTRSSLHEQPVQRNADALRSALIGLAKQRRLLQTSYPLLLRDRARVICVTKKHQSCSRVRVIGFCAGSYPCRIPHRPGILNTVIVLFTDFGEIGPYVGQVKAVLERDAPGIPVIDLLHDAPMFQARSSSYLLSSLIDVFPPDVVFLCVVDPGVGGSRAPAIVTADGRRFVGPDNGLFEIVMRRASERSFRRITWEPQDLSASFHGRDLFAPVAARLAKGDEVASEARPEEEARRPHWPNDLREIVYLDNFGNAMTGLRAKNVPTGSDMIVNDHRLTRARTFSDLPEGSAFWYENSSGLVEFSVNQGDAKSKLNIDVGSEFSIDTMHSTA